MQQTHSGIDSLLYAQARERVRDFGRAVEEKFADLAPAEREAFLEQLGTPHGIGLAVYDDRGQLVAGPKKAMPAGVAREVMRRGGGEGRRRPPMFLVKDAEYWFGYFFPLVVAPGNPPVRHTLAVVVPSVLTNSFFFDWRPWVFAGIGALAVTMVCWLPLVRRFTRSLERLRTASAEIAQGRFDVQLPAGGRDEFAELAGSVRKMAEQLQRQVEGQRRFLADAAHELCAPLSRIQLSTGILGQNVTGGNASAVARLERDVTQMSALVGDLLAFTRGNARALQVEPVALAAVVERAVAQECGASADVRVNVPEGLRAMADAECLGRAVANLLRNAIRYAGGGGPVSVEGRVHDGKVMLAVEDSGPGLPESDLELIFEPFYRPDAVRTPGSGGAGLGLAIVKTCVEACGGVVWCKNRQPHGLAVTIALRSASDEAAAAPRTH